ncbi:LacI family DNA-binding transcriptional regulator [Nakamurella sp. GG22]
MTTARVTLTDVAQRAGVSRTTASFVMTGRRDMRISSEAEQRVLRAARELNYRPSLLARSLRSNLSQTIGLLSDMIASEVFAGEVVRGAMTTALLHDHLMFIGETEGDTGVEKRLVQSMLDRGVGGFVYASMYTRNVRVSKTLREHPLVLLNSVARGRMLPSVIPDDLGAGRAAARELLRHGHRDQIVVVGERTQNVLAAAERLAGVEGVLREQGTELMDSIDVLWWPEYAYTAVSEFLAAGSRPTAFICLNDRVAMGTYQAIQHFGMTVPLDVSVISFDDSDLAHWLRPQLTSIAIPHFEMGRRAVETLLSLDRAPGVQRIPMPLRERESVGPPPARRRRRTPSKPR